MSKQQKVITCIEMIIPILAIFSVLVDVCLMPIRRETSLALMIILFVLNVLKCIKGKTLKSKLLYTVLNILIIVFVLIGTYFNPYRNSISFNFFANYDCDKFGTE